MALPLRCPKRTHSHQRSDQKRRVFRDLSILGKGALCASHSPFFTSHKGTSQKSAEFAPANLPFQIQANTLRTGECSLRISLFFPLFPASLPQVPLSLVPCATTCAVLAEPQGSSRKGRAVAGQAGSRSYPRQGTDPGEKTAKDEERQKEACSQQLCREMQRNTGRKRYGKSQDKAGLLI